MPTILLCKGWRIFFYANEQQEPIHVHCQKERAKAKFWLLPEQYDLQAAYVRHITRSEEREIRKILFTHFDELVAAWDEFKEKANE